MHDSDEIINILQSVVSKEEDELNSSKRQHHTDWDNHIFTLSTASLGFTFTFLPVASENHSWALFSSVFSFVLSICFAAVNYIFADYGFNNSYKGIAERRKINLRLSNSLAKLKSKTKICEMSNDVAGIEAANVMCNEEVVEILSDVSMDDEIAERNKLNKRITFLNHAKTYTFLLGVIFTVTFTLSNLKSIGNDIGSEGSAMEVVNLDKK